eukprot:1524040-Heterocapsa_arctica.AAC.1
MLSARMEWDTIAADIQSASMQGEAQDRPQDLYMQRPPEGLHGMRPGQLIQILKGVFGLATAPRQWWTTSSKALHAVPIVASDGEVCHLVSCPLDPALMVAHTRD